MLFWLHYYQIIIELNSLNDMIENQYIYVYRPPSIFMSVFQESPILSNRLRVLALQYIYFTQPFLFRKMHNMVITTFRDPTIVFLIKKYIFDLRLNNHFIRVESFDDQNTFYKHKRYGFKYRGPEKMALVIPNNSDAFGRNIETEGESSVDGIVGNYSNAAYVLSTARKDLLFNIHTY
jgi:hypothetical protein